MGWRRQEVASIQLGVHGDGGSGGGGLCGSDGEGGVARVTFVMWARVVSAAASHSSSTCY